VISMTKSHLFLMLCCLKAQRSWAKNIAICIDSPNFWVILFTVDDGIIVIKSLQFYIEKHYSQIVPQFVDAFLFFC